MHPSWSDESQNPGISDSAIGAWNERTGRQLPGCIEALLREHDGGILNRWEVHALAEIKVVDQNYLEEEWQMHETFEEWSAGLEESGLPGDARLFPFARKGNTFYWF